MQEWGSDRHQTAVFELVTEILITQYEVYG